MALSANLKLQIRMAGGFGYLVAPLVHVYAGALLMLNAAQQLQPIQTAGGVVFAGVADRELDNSASATVSATYVVAQRNIIFKAVVPGAATANLEAPVYATGDGTFTLSSNSGANPQVGYLAGFEGGTWVRIVL